MSDMPDFIDRDADVEGEKIAALQEISILIGELDTWSQRKTELVDALAEVDSHINELSALRIPELFKANGLSKLELSDGRKVSIDSGITVKVPDELQGKFIAFLESRGETDIIKLQMAFARMADYQRRRLFEFLETDGYAFEASEGVHYQTMQKYFKELLGFNVDEKDRAVGVEQGVYLHPDTIADFANVFEYSKTKIQMPSKKRGL